jgi:cytochrome c5
MWLIRAAAVVFVVSLLSVPASSQTPTPVEELPEGDGKKILQAQCTSCHELTEVTKFRGYYNRAQWRDIVVTMVEYGAKVEEKDVEVLTDYLVEHLGKK